jgi:hypothetical protein
LPTDAREKAAMAARICWDSCIFRNLRLDSGGK